MKSWSILIDKSRDKVSNLIILNEFIIGIILCENFAWLKTETPSTSTLPSDFGS